MSILPSLSLTGILFIPPALPLSISDFKTSNVFFRVKYDLKEDSVPGAGSPEAFCIDFQVRQMS